MNPHIVRFREERQRRTRELEGINLRDVADALGGTLEVTGTNKTVERWKFGPEGNRTHRIEVNESLGLFRCPINRRSGKGAISLVMFVQGSNFNDAFRWLESTFGKNAEKIPKAVQPASSQNHASLKEKGALVMPERDREAWPNARRHLIQTRGLDPQIVDDAASRGDLYATSRISEKGKKFSNIVMVMRDAEGEIRGAEVKGMWKPEGGKRFSAIAANSDKHRARFVVGDRLEKADVVMVTESGIDAMAALDHLRRKPGFEDFRIAVISSSGDGAIPQSILESIRPDAIRLGGQDKDKQGEALFSRMGEGWTRYAPQGSGKDWGDWAEEEMRLRIEGNRPRSRHEDGAHWAARMAAEMKGERKTEAPEKGIAI